MLQALLKVAGNVASGTGNVASGEGDVAAILNDS